MLGEQKIVVVTGASSFVGMHLAMGLSKDFKVVATYNREPQEEIRVQRLEELKKRRVNLEKLDITNLEELIRFIRLYKPYAWINHAGYTDQYSSLEYNQEKADHIHIYPLDTLGEELGKIGTKILIGTGTGMEYGDSGNAHKEDEECHPTTPYGKCKLRQTIKTLEIGRKNKIKTSIVRVFIPYGQWDHPNKMLSQMQRALKQHKHFEMSEGSQLRSFIPVDKLCQIYSVIINKGFEGIVNGAYEPAQSVKEFSISFAQKLGADVSLLGFGELPLRKTEVPVQTADLTGVLKLLGE